MSFIPVDTLKDTFHSFFVTPYHGWLNILSDSYFCSNFRHLARRKCSQCMVSK